MGQERDAGSAPQVAAMNGKCCSDGDHSRTPASTTPAAPTLKSIDVDTLLMRCSVSMLIILAAVWILFVWSRLFGFPLHAICGVSS